MKKISLTVLSLFLTHAVSFAQNNIVRNGNFENGGHGYSGTPPSFNFNVDNWSVGCSNPSPDIFDANTNSGLCSYGVPVNMSSDNRGVHISGNRYAGQSPGESMIGELDDALLENCTYEVEFSVAPKGTYSGCASPHSTTSGTVQIELVLRKSSNLCGGPSTVIYTSPSISMVPNTNAPWQTINGSFSLTATQASQGYDRIEVRASSSSNVWAYYYFDDFSIVSDCCPTDLGLDIDCINSTINITELPAGSNVISTTWYKKSKGLGGTLMMSGSGLISSYSPSSNGFYQATVVIQLQNGQECVVSETINYSDQNCCEELYGENFAAEIDATSNIIRYDTYTSQSTGNVVDVPVICNHDRFYDFVTHLCQSVEGYSIYNSVFDINSWTDVYTTYHTAGSGMLPSTISLYVGESSGQCIMGEVNHLVIYVTDPGLTPTFQEVHILYIPHHEDCEGEWKRNEMSQYEFNAEANDELQFSLSPNPTTGIINIESSVELIAIELIDELGRTIEVYLGDKETIEITGEPGVYFLKITTQGQESVVRVVKH